LVRGTGYELKFLGRSDWRGSATTPRWSRRSWTGDGQRHTCSTSLSARWLSVWRMPRCWEDCRVLARRWGRSTALRRGTLTFLLGSQTFLGTIALRHRTCPSLTPTSPPGLGSSSSAYVILGMFGRAPGSSRSNKTAPLHFFPAKHPSSKNSRPTKSMDLAPNSTKSTECLKGYSMKPCFVLTHGVG
jgi:hypothetical protein